MAKIKPLLCYFHAVEMDEIYEEFYKIPCDKWDIAYFKYPYGQRLAEGLLKKNPEYTHLVLVANDMIPTKECFEQLVKDLEEYDYPVLSGVVNVDMNKLKNHYNVCFNLPSLEYAKRHYRWMPESVIKTCLDYGAPIQKVKFSGFPMMFIRRDVLEKTRINYLDPKLTTIEDAVWDRRGGFANDLCFANNCHVNNIPIHADLRCKMKHFGLKGKQKVGINKPKLTFIRNGEIPKSWEKRKQLLARA